jgi:hypothetical protein
MIIIGADFHPEFQQIALSFTTWVGKLKEVWALACPGFTSAHRALYGIYHWRRNRRGYTPDFNTNVRSVSRARNAASSVICGGNQEQFASRIQ